MTNNQKFPQEEKLKKKIEIDWLFEKGKWFSSGNLRIKTLNLDRFPNESCESKIQKVGVSVSKRNFKKAVDRNRIKRLLREVYRLNKTDFINKFGAHSLSMIFWVSNDLPKDYEEVKNEFLKLCESKK